MQTTAARRPRLRCAQQGGPPAAAPPHGFAVPGAPGQPAADPVRLNRQNPKGGAGMQAYKTVAKEAADEYIVKKSRFIGYAKPVTTQQEAIDFIAEIKSKHWDATHNVYAYRLRDGQQRRYSDDGEPQGTAGVPALDVLNKAGVTDCVVVCTRYFGGIMLGAGGLVRAYGHTAKIALDAAGIITMAPCTLAAVTCDYTLYGKLNPLLCRMGAIVEDTAFSDVVRLQFRIPTDDYAALCAEVIDQSNGRVRCEALGEGFAQI